MKEFKETKGYKYIIIGNSAAGIGTVEGIRKIDTDGSIAILSSEIHHTYSRPLISYLLEGKTDTERMKYRAADFYSVNKCDTFFGKTVTSLDADAHTVNLDDGTCLKYSKLMVSTGSEPFVPPFKGLETVENKHAFMTLDDALSLDKALSDTKDAKVLIIGAGLIGLKCCEGIAGKAGSIAVVDMSPRILSSILTDEAAQIVQKHIESRGVSFYLGQTVSEFDGKKALLSGGEELSFDILVLAVGVRPRVSLVKDAGGEVGRGIITDKYQKTSLADVYAAGDCTESIDISYGQSRILALLPNAYRQGEAAGFSMAGCNFSFDCAIPMNAIGFFGLHMVTAGTYDGETYIKKDDNGYKVLYYKDNLLKGYIIIGNVERAGIYTSLIRERIPLDTIDFELICERPALMAFSQSYRAEKLGGISI